MAQSKLPDEKTLRMGFISASSLLYKVIGPAKLIQLLDQTKQNVVDRQFEEFFGQKEKV